MKILINKWQFLSLIVRELVDTFVTSKEKPMQLPLHKLLSAKNLVLTCAMILMVIGSSQLNAQGWEFYYGGAADEEATAVVQTGSEGFTVTGYSQSFGSDGDFDIYLARIDVDGQLVWEKGIDEGFIERGRDLVETPDGGFLIAGISKLDASADNFDAYLLKVDADGNYVWSTTFGGDEDELFSAITPTTDGGYVLAGYSESFSPDGNEEIYLVKVDANGQEIWSKTYGGLGEDRANEVVETTDGFYLTGDLETDNGDTTLIFLLKTDTDGDEVWMKTYGQSDFNQGEGLVLDSEGNLVITGHQDYDFTVLKTDAQGEEIWSTTIPLGEEESIGFDVIETNDDHYAIAGVNLITAVDGEILVIKIDRETGDPIWTANHGRNTYLDYGRSLVQSKDGGFVVAGYNSIFVGLLQDVTLLKMNSTGDIYSSYIQGKVFFDNQDVNCEYDAGEPGLDDWLIEVSGENNTYYASTNPDGSYSVLVDTGSYDIRLLTLNPYWEACVETYNGVEVNSVYDTLLFDFPTHGLIECPLPVVDISTPYVLPCYDLTYTAYYANQGPVTATDVSVEILLDDELSYVSSSVVPDQQIGDSLFIFLLNELGPGETGIIELIATADCEVEAGQAVSASAFINPDSLCLDPDPLWDGSSLDVDGRCDPDSVRFQVQNIGTGDMLIATNYIVIEDEVMAISQPVDLDSGDSINVSLPPSGATYRIIAEQVIGHPGNSYPTAVVEGCVDGGAPEFSTGFVLQFPEDEAIPFTSVDVQEALDPTATAAASLRGYPKGYQAENLITNGTRIDYQVFFQNTSLDTVYRVVVRDTLSEHLDLETIRAGASSHPYDFVVYEEGYVKFIFDDIVLPPQSVDQDASFGSFMFSIDLEPNLAEGTVIDNRVAIYVGFQDPMLSNEVFHTIGGELVQDYIIVDIDQPEIPGTDIRVYPNPFTESAILEVDGIELKAFELRIYDQTGRMVRMIEGAGNSVEIGRSSLPQGAYFFHLISEGQVIGTGKILIQ